MSKWYIEKKKDGMDQHPVSVYKAEVRISVMRKRLKRNHNYMSFYKLQNAQFYGQISTSTYSDQIHISHAKTRIKYYY